MPINLVFDYDGTIHESIKIYAPAFRKAYEYLVNKNLAEPKNFSDSEIGRWLGYSAKNMWQEFMPNIPESEKEKCSKMIGDEMLNSTKNGCAKLYSGSINVLKKLKNSGYNLIFLSNCKHEYMKAHFSAFNLGQFFSASYCTEDFGFISKPKIFEEFKNNFNGDYIIIGDRFLDMELAEKSGYAGIGCAYGYGTPDELKSAQVIINSINELEEAIRLIQKG